LIFNLLFDLNLRSLYTVRSTVLLAGYPHRDLQNAIAIPCNYRSPVNALKEFTAENENVEAIALVQ
jgi:hypothetical protein